MGAAPADDADMGNVPGMLEDGAGWSEDGEGASVCAGASELGPNKASSMLPQPANPSPIVSARPVTAYARRDEAAEIPVILKDLRFGGSVPAHPARKHADAPHPAASARGAARRPVRSLNDAARPRQGRIMRLFGENLFIPPGLGKGTMAPERTGRAGRTQRQSRGPRPCVSRP